MESSDWTIGESVVVKPGVSDPDTNDDISGWQGRITAIFDEAGTLTIQWDSVTLKSLPSKHILCDLQPTRAKTKTRQLVEDYAVWFANR